MRIHESSPGGASSDKLAKEGQNYVATHFFPDVEPGQVKNGILCQDIEHQTFPDEAFDIVITQDVFEHIPDPQKGFAEIHRTLKRNGAHIFTLPWYHWKNTVKRAVKEDSKFKYLLPPEYHGNPIDSEGSLVFTEWGRDLCDSIYRWSRMTTTVIRILDRYRGIDGKFIEVFLSKKNNGR
jgi:SAM-dependent methyltransferase